MASASTTPPFSRRADREEKVNEQDEKSLANALVKVTREKKKVLYFTEGHGEGQTDVIAKDGFSIVRDRCRDLNYEVKTLVIAQEGAIPENCEVLLVLGPKTAFLENETKLIRGYLKAGGKALFLIDPGQGAGLENLVKEWYVNLGDDFVVDASGIGSLFGVDYSMPIAAEVWRARHHRATRGRDDPLSPRPVGQDR